jgi:hypothetical protein
MGAEASVQVILIPPLFDESNRLRRTLVDVMRGLAAKGFGVALPDFPATGESLTDFQPTTFDDWQIALGALVSGREERGQTVLLAAFRGGALIDHAAEVTARWRLAEETGQRLLRDLSRMILARSFRAKGDDPLDESGYIFPPAFKAALENAAPQPASKLRSVRLMHDPKEADARIEGSPLWRRAEPSEDPLLTKAIITDIAEWAASCAAS